MEKEELEQKCIFQIQECAKDNGGYISTIIYKQSGRTPTFHNIISVFGTWNNAMKHAKVMSKEEFYQYCKGILNEFLTRFPNNPSYEMYDVFKDISDKIEYPTSKQIIRALGKWKTILKDMNFWDIVLEAYPKELCSTHIRNCALIHNGNVTGKLYEEYRKGLLLQEPMTVIPSYEIIVDIFGSWNAAMEESDLSKVRAKLLLDFVGKEQMAKRAAQQRIEITNPYSRKR